MPAKEDLASVCVRGDPLTPLLLWLSLLRFGSWVANLPALAPWPLVSVPVTLLRVGLKLWVTFSFSGLFRWDVKLALCHTREVYTHGGSSARGSYSWGTSVLTFFTHSCISAGKQLSSQTLNTQESEERSVNEKKKCSFWKLRKPRKAQVLLFANSGNPKRFWNVAGRFLRLLRKLCQV